MKLQKCPEKFLNRNLADMKLVTGFSGLPMAEDAGGYDMVFYSIPYQISGGKDRTGAEEGAAYIRRRAEGYGLVDQNVDIDMGQSIKAADMGSLTVDDSSKASVLSGISEAESLFLGKGAVPYSFGGDDGTALPQIEAAAAKYSDLAVVAFTGSVSDSLMTAITEGTVKGESCIHVGVRDGMKPYKDDLKKTHMITSSEMDYMKFDEVAGEIKKVTGGHPILVLFDVNFLDPAIAPCTAHPAVGGFSEYETVILIEKALMGEDIKALALYGVIPYHDDGEVGINNISEVLNKLYAVTAYDLAEK